MQESTSRTEEITLWDAFKKWHNALGEYWLKEYKHLNLDADYMLDLVCGTDPNVWEGEVSADPSIYEQVKKITNKTDATKLNSFQAYKEIKEAFNKIFNYSKEHTEAYQKAEKKITYAEWIKAN